MPAKTQENSASARVVAIANPCAIANLLRIVNLLRRSIFSTTGSFGKGGNVPSSKTSRGCPLGNKFWRPVALVVGKGCHYERGLFTGVISRISKISRFSRKLSDSPLLPKVGGGVL